MPILPIIACKVSVKGICIETNRMATEMFGYTYEELIGIFGTDAIAPESKELVKHNMLSGYEEPYEVVALRKDGSTFHAEIRGKMTEYKGQKVRVTVVHDINDRKEAEVALRQSEETLKSILTASPAGIGLVRRRPRGWASQAMCKRVGQFFIPLSSGVMLILSGDSSPHSAHLLIVLAVGSGIVMAPFEIALRLLNISYARHFIFDFIDFTLILIQWIQPEGTRPAVLISLIGAG